MAMNLCDFLAHLNFFFLPVLPFIQGLSLVSLIEQNDAIVPGAEVSPALGAGPRAAWGAE